MTGSQELRFVEACKFSDWRKSARQLLIDAISPELVKWIDSRQRRFESQGNIFSESSSLRLPGASAESGTEFRVSPDFIQLANQVAANRNAARWELLYRMLWRLTHGETRLLEIASDADVSLAREMAQAVHRDAHKMKAFVRFRKCQDAEGDLYVAWHRPLHYVVGLTADFFARRFDVMRWLIMTPDESVGWDGKQLAFGPGVSSEEASVLTEGFDQVGHPVDRDHFEDLWKTYYANIFNPARIKLKAMQAQMPKHHWKTLPETTLIDEMLRAAPKRVEQMVQYQEGFEGASKFIPDTRSLDVLADAAQACRGCDLYRNATQVVFGVGPANAELVLIGEQPGDHEDLEGVPFVGPAGKLLRSVMEEVGLDIDSAYVTNAVKHFKFKDSPTRRLHVKPSSREIGACHAWLDAEMRAIAPQYVVCLGATAASVVFGPAFKVTQQRGVVLSSRYSPWTLATFHPSALLRVPDLTLRKTMSEQFRSDLSRVASEINQSKQ